jgi:hypothetical protein
LEHKERGAVFEEIADPDLTEETIPSPDAEWGPIQRFALAFDGYNFWGSFDKCAEIANHWAQVFAERQGLADSLSELSTCLFFEQRRWHHFGYAPDDRAMIYIRALVEEIRRKVRAGEVG